MKGKDAEQERGKIMGGIIMSYALAHGENPESTLEELTRYLSARVEAVASDTVRGEVKTALNRIESPKKNVEVLAKLFKKDGSVRRYRYGSGFCPTCGMFKDYHKECPYCGHHEFTR